MSWAATRRRYKDDMDITGFKSINQTNFFWSVGISCWTASGHDYRNPQRAYIRLSAYIAIRQDMHD
jgi:hypothetical protein